MNGVHDMGGMHGFGPIDTAPDQALFHAPWEGRARSMAVQTMARGYFTLDAFRRGIEEMAPQAYLAASYFNRWLTSVESNLVEQGLVTREELAARAAHFQRNPDVPPPSIGGPRRPPPAPAGVQPLPDLTPRFALGDRVLTRNVHPGHHTRIPRYARGKVGVVQIIHGPQIFADTNAHGLGENPQVLYNILFNAADLWGESAEPHQGVALDLWESYLERDAIR